VYQIFFCFFFSFFFCFCFCFCTPGAPEPSFRPTSEIPRRDLFSHPGTFAPKPFPTEKTCLRLAYVIPAFFQHLRLFPLPRHAFSTGSKTPMDFEGLLIWGPWPLRLKLCLNRVVLRGSIEDDRSGQLPLRGLITFIRLMLSRDSFVPPCFLVLFAFSPNS